MCSGSKDKLPNAKPTRRVLIGLGGVSALLTIALVAAVSTGTLALWVPGQCTYNTGSIGSASIWLVPLLAWGLLVALAGIVLTRSLGPPSRWSNAAHWAVPAAMAIGCTVFWVHVAIIEPMGFFKLAAVVANEASCGYFTQAVETPRADQVFEQYRLRPFEMRHHTINKPPGMVLFSAAVVRLAERSVTVRSLADMALRIKPGMNLDVAARLYSGFWSFDYQPRHVAAALLWALLTIAFCAGAMVPLYRLALEAVGPTVALASAGLFALVPAFAMSAGTVDLAYLLPVSWAMYLWWRGFAAGLGYAAATGLLLGLGLLGSWMFASVAGWFALWALLHHALGRNRLAEDTAAQSALAAAVWRIAVMALVVAAVAAGFFTWAGLNPWQLLQNSHIAQAAEMAAAGRQYHLWMFFNLADFFVFLGMPLTVILGHGLVRRPSWHRLDVHALLTPAVAALAAILVVNFSGQLLGETARLWMLFMPPFVIAAAALGHATGFPRAMWALTFALMLLQFVVFRHVILLGGWI